jgi:hypothetical protein
MDTAQQIIDRVLIRLEDPDNRFFATADLVLAYNDALDELSEATEVNENYVTIKRRKWAAYSDLRGYLPPDVLRITAIWNPSSERWLHPVTVRDLDDTLGRQWENKPDNESRWWWTRGIYFLGTYPVPGTDNSPLRIHYVSQLPHVEEKGGLVTGLTVAANLPPDFSTAIEHYMMYALLVQKKESQKAMEHWVRYQSHEGELKDLSKNRMRRDKVPRMGARRTLSGMGVRR